jgi:hypothetical protein
MREPDCHAQASQGHVLLDVVTVASLATNIRSYTYVHTHIHTVTCVCVTTDGVWIGFIDHFNTRLVTILNYIAIVGLRTLQTTTGNAKSF